MKIRKRVLAGVLAGVLAAGMLMGCGNDAVTSNPGSSGTGTTKTGTKLLAAKDLVVNAAYPSDDSFFDNATGTFNEEGYDKAWREWTESASKRQELAAKSKAEYADFLLDISRKMIADPEVENPSFSPLNIYLSLGMLAEISEGETRAQILKAANADSLDDFYQTANALAQAVRRGDDAQTVDLGSSMWLSNKIPFKDETVQRAAERYFASITRGDFGSAEMDQALRDWLNEKTGGLLKEQVEGLKFDDPQLAMVLASTIYLKARWQDEFSKESTRDDTFHGKDGDKEVPFMHRREQGTVYVGEKFTAMRLPFVSGGAMYFLLPNKGVMPEELMEDAEARKFLAEGGDKWTGNKYDKYGTMMVDIALPKFDVTAEYDLKSILKQMGISDAFDVNKANFSSLAEDGIPFVLDKALHDARVKIDEEGVEAAAFTAYMLASGAMLSDELTDFKVDRPFLYMIESDTGIPLFVGAVNNI